MPARSSRSNSLDGHKCSLPASVFINPNNRQRIKLNRQQPLKINKTVSWQCNASLIRWPTTRQSNRPISAAKLKSLLTTGAIRANEAASKAYGQNVANIQDASSRKYRTEQLKLKEARDAQAFKTQEIYAKQIGAQGKVLATGQIGASIGAQVRDTQRQAGFAEAKEAATFESKATQSALAMEDTAIQEESALNNAFNALPAPVQAPQLARDLEWRYLYRRYGNPYV